MTLPEHELNRQCHHKRTVDVCPAIECQDYLSEREADAARERWERYAETGEDEALTETERASLYD